MKRWLPWILVVLAAAWVVTGSSGPKSKNGFNTTEFGKLPVLLNGRIQPFDSVGKNTLLSTRGKSSVRTEDKTTLSGTDWILEAMTRPDMADTRKIFRVQHPDLEGLLGADKAGLQYYSFNDLTNHLDKIEEQVRTLRRAEMAKQSDPQTRTPFQKDLMHLYESLVRYHQIKNTLQPESSKDFAREIEYFEEKIGPGLAALQASQAGKEYDASDLQLIAAFFKRYTNVSATAYALIVPPRPGEPREAWSNIGTAMMESMRKGEVHPAIKHLSAISSAYANNDAPKFNSAVAEYRAWLQTAGYIAEIKKGNDEYRFNALNPFSKAMIIYVAALILGCVFWVNMSEPVRRCAFALLVFAFIVHTIGLGYRMYLEGRPPVTNLYSSAVFVGWGIAALAIIIERFFKIGLGIVIAGAGGFATLIIADHLSLSGDTMEMLRAVLDTNFWLATHVVCITIGYSSMFVAGLVAIIYILLGFFTRNLTSDTARILSRVVYGIVCVATLFSFVGTILGGIWADQSWGRFWGWDPKENGALLIVIWNAVILHARWGKLVGERGIMAMAVFGNIVTSFSWFGVNMLGVGLHSYGFMDAAFFWLMLFIVTQAILIGLALMPAQLWASFKGVGEPETGARGEESQEPVSA